MTRSLFAIAVLLILVLVSGCGVVKIRDRPSTGIEGETAYGPPLKEVRIFGLNTTKEIVVLRQLASKIGDPYTQESAYQDYRNLDRLKVFSSIQLDTVPDGDGVILEITVTEVNPYTPTVTIGITDENGFSFGLGASSANLLGTALKANASFNTGGQSGVKAGLASPWRAGNLLQYDVKFSWQVRDNKADQFRENAVEITTIAQKNIGTNFRAGALFDFFSIGSDVDGITLSETNRDNVPRLGVFVGLDSRDFPRSPQHGWFTYLDVGQSGGFLGGPADYVRGNVDIRGYITPWERHTFALFSLTTATSGVVGEDIPIWDDFHLGGTNTVRGWTYGARVGKDQSLATTEYRFLLLEPKLVQIAFIKMDMGLQLAVFGDAGWAWNSVDRPDEEFIFGGGIGIRLLLPSVDMIRFDFGIGEAGAQVTLHIGSNSKATSQRRRVR